MRPLLLLLGIVAASVALPAAAASPRHKDETFWWRTSDAAVVEFDHNRCAMLLYNMQNAFVFIWRRSGVTLDVEDLAGRFPSSPKIPVAVQVGQNWLGHPTKSSDLNLIASGDTMFRFIPLSEPVVPLLAKARSITLHLAAAEVKILVDPGKMPALLRASRKCRRVIR